MQHTLNKEVSFSGIGLHTGQTSTILFKPAPVNRGILFIKTDQGGMVEAVVDNVFDTRRGVSLAKNGVVVSTVEHVLAALSGCEIDNAIIEIDSDEPPAGDGSARQLVELFQTVGIRTLDADRRTIEPKDPIWVSDKDSFIGIFPSKGLRITCFVDFDHPFAPPQSTRLVCTPRSFASEIAPARTFVFQHELQRLWEEGFAKGGTLSNSIVIGERGLLNRLRYTDELIRHKVLDLIGDLFLLGGPLHGEIVAFNPNHTLNVAFVRKIKENGGL
jgi:UDP-3-O-acyl N-acetylglucosamine deacetylase